MSNYWAERSASWNEEDIIKMRMRGTCTNREHGKPLCGKSPIVYELFTENGTTWFACETCGSLNHGSTWTKKRIGPDPGPKVCACPLPVIMYRGCQCGGI